MNMQIVERGGSPLAARRRALLSAFTVDPMAGSESLVGWQRAVYAARHFDTWVICAPHVSKEGIDAYLRVHGPVPGLEIVYVEEPKWMEMLEHVPGLYYLSYNLWQRRAYRAALRLDTDVGFDLVHQVNLGGYREPGYLWRLGSPFVWGPIGGTQNYPMRFLVQAGIGGGLREAVRTMLNTLTLRMGRRIRQAAARSAAIRAANSTVADDLARALGCKQIPVMLETGAPPVANGAAVRPTADVFRVMWAGEFKAFKALPMLLDALRILPDDVAFELTVVGDGRELGRWQHRARRLGLDDRIRWTGWIDHERMVEQYEDADLFVFTSLRDTSGNVVLEALANGVPVVAPAHQGVGDIVTDTCGVLVPVTTHWEMVRGYRDAIASIARDRARHRHLSDGARERADHYSWERQGERMLRIYDGVLTAPGVESSAEASGPNAPSARPGWS